MAAILPIGQLHAPIRLLSALTTEHFVLETAYGTRSRRRPRAARDVMALSRFWTSLRCGFLSASRELFVPFAATVLRHLSLGLFTVIRLVDTGLESMHYLCGIAHIRRPVPEPECRALRVSVCAERGRGPKCKTSAPHRAASAEPVGGRSSAPPELDRFSIITPTWSPRVGGVALRVQVPALERSWRVGVAGRRGDGR